MAKEKMLIEYRSQGGVDVRLTPQMVVDYLVQGNKQNVLMEEIVYFMHVCKARKLNPFIKDCYLIKYGNDPAAIVTSVDYFRKNARKADDCEGWKAGIIIKHEPLKIERREGNFILPDEELVGGWAQGKPKGWAEAMLHQINLEPYVKKTRDGRITRFWAKERQPDMIAKVAECQLLRKLWGEESTGMYAPEEMPSLEDVAHEPVQSDIKKRVLGKVEPEKFETVDTKPEKTETAETAEKVKTYEPPITETAETVHHDLVDIEDTFYKLAETCKISRKDAFAYVEAKHESTEVSIADIMQMINEDPKKEFEAMVKWLKARDAGQDTKADKKPVVGGSMPDIQVVNSVWEVDSWWRKKSSTFADHIWKNINSLEDESDELKAELKRKWTRFYQEPFPQPKTEQTTNNGIKTQTVFDPRDSQDNGEVDAEFEAMRPQPEDPIELNKWFLDYFPEERTGAMKYLGFTDTPQTLSKDALERWNQSIQQLIDMRGA